MATRFWALLGLMVLTSGTAMAADSHKPGEVFKDCATCPEFIVLPAGSFDMGTPDDERRREGVLPLFGNREGVIHKVTFAKPFAMSKFEVTRGEYAEYARQAKIPDECSVYDAKTDTWPLQKGFSWEHPGFAQTDRHPAVCISWNDATAFAQWLSKKTGKRYRLPSEAEWEYGARAGTTTARSWGDGMRDVCEQANIMTRGTLEKLGWPKSWNDKLHCTSEHSFTMPVGSFPPNAFGLYDMIGNVWEAVADCYHDTYTGAPTDGSVWEEPDCKFRFPRGGGFHSEPWLARSGTRGKGPANYPGVAAGIRLVRILD